MTDRHQTDEPTTDDQTNEQGNEQAAGSADAVGTAEKDPQDWVTGDEPMTGPQKSYLETLQQQAGESGDVSGLSKAQASERIDELQAKTGRGQS